MNRARMRTGGGIGRLRGPDIRERTASLADAVARHRIAIGGVLVVAAALLLFGGQLPRAHSGDDLQYAMVITQATSDLRFYHPSGERPYAPGGPAAEPFPVPLNMRYPLEWPTAIAVTNAWQQLGWRGDAIAPILAWRVLAGTVGAACFYLALVLLCGNAGIALAATAGLLSSAAYRHYSTHLDQSIMMVALLCLALLVAAWCYRANALDARALVLLPAIIAVATAYNFTAAIAAAVAIFTIIRAVPAGGPLARARRGGQFALVYGLALVVIGGLALAAWGDPGSAGSRGFWQSTAFAGHYEYTLHPLADAARAALGFAKAQVTYPGGPSLQETWSGGGFAQRLQLLGFYAPVLAALAVPLLLLAWPRRSSRQVAAPRFPILLGLVAYGLFNWWWDPGYIKYWLIPLVAWWAGIALVLRRLHRAGGRWYRLAHLLVAALIVASLAASWLAGARAAEDTAAQDWAAIARALRQSPAEALFISAGNHPLDFAIAYESRRDVLSLALISYGTGGDQYGAGGDWDRVRECARARIAQHLAAGGPIYIYGFDGTSPSLREARAALPAGTLRVAWSFPQLTIYALSPAQPPAVDRVAGAVRCTP